MSTSAVLAIILAGAFTFCACKTETPAPGRAGKPTVGGASRVAFPDSTEDTHLYGVKSGIVEMSVETRHGSTVGHGTAVTYFDEFGLRQASRYTDSSVAGVTTTVQILGDSSIVYYNPVSKEGTKIVGKIAPNAIANVIVRTLYTPDSVRAQSNLKQLEDREFLGKTCKGYSIAQPTNSYKAWLWKKIPLHTEDVAGDNTVIMTATSLKTDEPLPPDVFIVPSDVKLNIPGKPQTASK